jgi:hypothetical protein
MITKKRVNISISEDTSLRLKQYAKEHHTNVSQAITDWIWSVNLIQPQPKGHQAMESIALKRKNRRKNSVSS